MKKGTKFYNEKRFEVFETLNEIKVYKKRLFGFLSWYATFLKDYYSYKFDTTMHIIREKEEAEDD